MKRVHALLTLLLGFCSAFCSAQLSTGGPITFAPSGTNSFTVNVVLVPSSIPVAATSQVTALLTNGATSTNVTNQCQWSSSNPAVATLSGTLATGVSSGTSNITCIVGANGTFPGVTGFSVLSVAPAPLITTPSCGTPPCALPAGTNGTAYGPFSFTASGGTPPYTWDCNGSCAAVPPFTTWASLNASTGAITGTPNATTSYSWTTRVTDSLAQSTTLAVTLTVNASAACGTPPNYCARNDLAIVRGPNNPPFTGLTTGVGTCVADDLNAGLPGATSMERLTGYNTTNVANDYFTVASSSTSRQWNSTGTIFTTQQAGGKAAFFSVVNGTCPTVQYRGNAIQDVNSLALSASPEWSGNIANSFFSGGASQSGPGWFRATLNTYTVNTAIAPWTTCSGTPCVNDLSGAITGTVILDPINLPGLTTYNAGPLGPTWNRYIAHINSDSTSDKLDHVYCVTYRYQQDDGSLIVCYDSSQASTFKGRWLDTKTGQVGGDYGPTGATTGYTPLPPPAAPTVSLLNTSGNLDCTHQYYVAITYTVRGTNFWGGESTPSPITQPTPTTGAGCTLQIISPTANPGALFLATGYNVYYCDHTLNPGCSAPSTLNMRASNANPSGNLAPPSVTSVTCNTTGTTTTYNWYVVAVNAGGASATGPASANTTCRNYAPGAAVHWLSVANATSYYVLRDNVTVMVCTATQPGGGAGIDTTCTDSNQNPHNFVNQTIPIGTTATITNISGIGGVGPPTVNMAGIQLHNIRIDESGTWVIMEVADAFAATQGSAPMAPEQLMWHIGTTALIPNNPGVQSLPYASYGASHWSNGFNGIKISWPSSGATAQLVLQSLTDTVSLLTGTCPTQCTFLNAVNGNVDTESGDEHLSHANSINAVPDTPVFMDRYRTHSPFPLPNSPYSNEIISFPSAPTSSNPNAYAYRHCHNWDSAAEGFNATPRGGINQAGTLYIFTSDMQVNGLGAQGTSTVGLGAINGTNTNGNYAPGLACNTAGTGTYACRFDIFMCIIK